MGDFDKLGSWREPCVRLCSSPACDHDRNRQGNEFDVLPEGLTPEVSNIKLDHFLKGHVAAPINLPVTGQPWFPGVPQPIMGAVAFDLVGKGGALSGLGF